jgi:hypothetical protein
MKQVTDGKFYNTETAQEIARYGSETLYRTRKGNWFIVHARNWGAEPLDQWVNPRSEREALRWLERYSDADIIMQHFADQVEEA